MILTLPARGRSKIFFIGTLNLTQVRIQSFVETRATHYDGNALTPSGKEIEFVFVWPIVKTSPLAILKKTTLTPVSMQVSVLEIGRKPTHLKRWLHDYLRRAPKEKWQHQEMEKRKLIYGYFQHQNVPKEKHAVDNP